MISDLGHAAFRSHDLEGALRFYGKLGIHEAFRLHHDDGSLMLVYLHVAGDRFIEVFPGGEAPGSGSKGSYMHLCLLVDDLEATVKDLREQGISLEREIKTGLDHNLQAWIRDPDGNDIELMQLVESSPQWRVAKGERL